jgi:anti-sigma factor RsiW
MNCEHVRKKLNAYMDAELPGGTAEKMAIHLEVCQDCSRVFSHLQNLTNVLEEVPTPEVPKGFADRVLANAHGRSTGVGLKQYSGVSVFPWWSRRFLSAQRAAAAAVLIVGLAIGALMGRDTWQSQVPQSGGKSQIAQVETVEMYNLDYLTDVPKGSLADAYLTLAFKTNARER